MDMKNENKRINKNKNSEETEQSGRGEPTSKKKIKSYLQILSSPLKKHPKAHQTFPQKNPENQTKKTLLPWQRNSPSASGSFK